MISEFLDYIIQVVINLINLWLTRPLFFIISFLKLLVGLFFAFLFFRILTHVYGIRRYSTSVRDQIIDEVYEEEEEEEEYKAETSANIIIDPEHKLIKHDIDGCGRIWKWRYPNSENNLPRRCTNPKCPNSILDINSVEYGVLDFEIKTFREIYKKNF